MGLNASFPTHGHWLKGADLALKHIIIDGKGRGRLSLHTCINVVV